MSKTIDTAERRAALLREKEANERKIEALKHKQEQLENQMTKEENRQSYLSSKERRSRTHRLVQKGAIIEHHAPETKELTEQEFYTLMEGVLNRPDIRQIIMSAVERHRRSELG